MKAARERAAAASRLRIEWLSRRSPERLIARRRGQPLMTLELTYVALRGGGAN